MFMSAMVQILERVRFHIIKIFVPLHVFTTFFICFILHQVDSLSFDWDMFYVKITRTMLGQNLSCDCENAKCQSL